jgi:hypothetical protein
MIEGKKAGPFQWIAGENGVASSMPEGAVFISSATMDPAACRRLAARLESAGRLYLDAPISGGAARAADGTLTVLALARGPPLPRLVRRSLTPANAPAANARSLVSLVARLSKPVGEGRTHLCAWASGRRQDGAGVIWARRRTPMKRMVAYWIMNKLSLLTMP